MGTCVKVISWNVRELNCSNKRGDVKLVLRRFAFDIEILQESKMGVVGRLLMVCGVGAMFNGCFCLQWGVREVLSLFGTIRFWSLWILILGLFLCVASLNP